MGHSCSLCHIDLKDVSVTRGGQTLLKDVSMHIHCGQLTVLIGQNGAGKTTLIRALLGQLPHGGEIHHLDGEAGISSSAHGYVPQHLDFDKEMPLTVEDFLAAAFSRRPVWTGHLEKTRARGAGGAGGGGSGVHRKASAGPLLRRRDAARAAGAGNASRAGPACAG